MINFWRTKFAGALIAIFLTAGYNTSIAAEQEKADTKFNMNEITCWDLGTVEEDVAAFTVVMLYGYFSGINGIAQQDGSKIEDKLIALGAKCEKNPEMTVIEAFRKTE